MSKCKSFEFLAIDLLYLDKDPVTVALIPRDIPDLSQWLHDNIKASSIGTRHIGVWAVPVTLQ